MVAAIAAAREGSHVTLLEHNDRVGKKILVTGNGKCNMTNKNMGSEYYRSENPGFVEQVLWKFPPEKIMDFFEKLGIRPVDRNGYIYPASGQAASVLDVLRMELEYWNVDVETGVHVKRVVRRDEVLCVEAEERNTKRTAWFWPAAPRRAIIRAMMEAAMRWRGIWDTIFINRSLRLCSCGRRETS